MKVLDCLRYSQEPVSLKLEEGIAIYPDDIGPRLPVLGLRALSRNRLHLAIDPERMRVGYSHTGLEHQGPGLVGCGFYRGEHPGLPGRVYSLPTSRFW